MPLWRGPHGQRHDAQGERNTLTTFRTFLPAPLPPSLRAPLPICSFPRGRLISRAHLLEHGDSTATAGEDAQGPPRTTKIRHHSAAHPHYAWRH